MFLHTCMYSLCVPLVTVLQRDKRTEPCLSAMRASAPIATTDMTFEKLL